MQPTHRPTDRNRNPIIEAARRAQIVEAAIEVIAEVGYADASLSRIARRAEVSKSVVSYHFDGKDELFQTLLAELYEDIWASIEPVLQAEETAIGKVRAHITALLTYARDNRSRLRAVGAVAINHRAGENSPHHAPGTDDPIVGMLADILRQGQLEGEFREFDADVMAVTINQALDGALAQFARNAEVDLDHYADELIALFTAAMARNDSSDGPRREVPEESHEPGL